MTNWKDRLVPDEFNRLKDNEILVFMSNLDGRHQGFSGAFAIQNGAIYGKGWGVAGHTYAIPIVDSRLKSLSLKSIASHILDFINFAKEHKDFNFLVYHLDNKMREIAPLFSDSIDVPNIFLPKEVWYIINNKNKIL